jgi:adenylosuccinate synthase
MDAIHEQGQGENKIGSTLKGIGPTYQDKIGRFGFRAADIFATDFKSRYQAKKEKHLSILKGMGCTQEVDDTQWFDAVEFMRALTFADTEYLLNDALQRGQSILAEGAQGTLLDIDFGTYPYVTSSNTISASVCTGLGIAPRQIRHVYGVMKAYCTRVGGGPFPTELEDELGEMLRQKGHEFGSTTGRPRRTGWNDLVALQYAIMLNGVDKLIMMKMDVLDGLETVSLCKAYTTADGSPAQFSALSFGEKVMPVYESCKGWETDITAAKKFQDLPPEAQQYIHSIEQSTGIPVSIISVGPDMNETIFRD